MTFEKYMQNSVGAGYDLRTILYNLSTDEIEESVLGFAKELIFEEKKKMLKKGIENRRFASGIDDVGFIYISQLEDLCSC